MIYKIWIINIMNNLIKEDKITFETLIDVSNIPEIERSNKTSGLFYFDNKNDLFRVCTKKGWKTVNLV